VKKEQDIATGLPAPAAMVWSCKPMKKEQGTLPVSKYVELFQYVGRRNH